MESEKGAVRQRQITATNHVGGVRIRGLNSVGKICITKC